MGILGNSSNQGSGLILAKGEKINLTKDNPGLRRIKVGLGWDVNTTGGKDFDLDALVFMVDANGRVPETKHFVYFGNLTSKDGAVRLSGDNRTGQGDGDDEVVTVDLDKVSPEIQRMIFAVSIYEAKERRQNFGQVRNAFIRLVNEDTNEQICRFDLTEDYSGNISMLMGEIYRHNGEWKFGTLGIGSNKSLNELVADYGL